MADDKHHVTNLHRKIFFFSATGEARVGREGALPPGGASTRHGAREQD